MALPKELKPSKAVEVVEVVEEEEEDVVEVVDVVFDNKLEGTGISLEAGVPIRVMYAKTGVSTAVKSPSSLFKTTGADVTVDCPTSSETVEACVSWDVRSNVVVASVDNRENLIVIVIIIIEWIGLVC
ncbi:hypothetical protein WICPIJ_000620 [Wickerhamomyces pijperi]|uniref:Uncharacterized protein n=1 Tax=Wickerhamomyces pijperi TaxID=599730 RepID=A0A9P8QFZ5_WICPI|nr:hypothetical protein WICPIJ_000620 [Wickerhamomyces pijperi]